MKRAAAESRSRRRSFKKERFHDVICAAMALFLAIMLYLAARPKQLISINAAAKEEG
jgi:hypothetical protein